MDAFDILVPVVLAAFCGALAFGFWKLGDNRSTLIKWLVRAIALFFALNVFFFLRQLF